MLLLVWAPIASAKAEIKSNNDMIKECLMAYGYDYNLPVDKRINTFNWNDASSCVSNFKADEQQKNIAKVKEFLKEKPWYKGPNWRWELRSEYECNKVYSDKGPITLCTKPYYLN